MENVRDYVENQFREYSVSILPENLMEGDGTAPVYKAWSAIDTARAKIVCANALDRQEMAFVLALKESLLEMITDPNCIHDVKMLHGILSEYVRKVASKSFGKDWAR